MTNQWQLLAVILCVVSCHGQVAKYTDGSMVFDIVWAGDEVSPPKMPDPLAPVHVEPHRLLSRNEDPAGETVVMTTSDKEQYQCVLPQLTSEERSDSDGHTPTIAELNSVLGPLRGQCISMLEGYWAYELCHWHHLRQYHQDEKPRDGKVGVALPSLAPPPSLSASIQTPGKLTEYVLDNVGDGVSDIVGVGVSDNVGDGVSDIVGVGVSDNVGVGVLDIVGVGVSDNVGVGVSDIVGVGVSVGDGVSDIVGDGVSDIVGVGVSDNVGDGVSDIVGVGVSDIVGVGVSDNVGVGVSDIVGVGVSDIVGVGVSDIVGVGVSDIIMWVLECQIMWVMECQIMWVLECQIMWVLECQIINCPMWYYNGGDYPYHRVQLGDGTPCEPKPSVRRRASIQYICLEDSHLFGTTIPPGIHLLPPQPPKGAEVPTLLETTPNTGSVQIDKQFVESFLSGEACLSGGGSSWWQHQVCFGLNVKQLHKDAVSYQEVYLGRWDEKAHKEWFSKAGKRKQSKNHVIHLYVNGDVCKESGVVRNCQVKFKCVPDARPSQITLYLEEPSLCSYVLTVEAGFICDLLQTVDEYGMFHMKDWRGSDTERPAAT
eukprot:Em0028g16a